VVALPGVLLVLLVRPERPVPSRELAIVRWPSRKFAVVSAPSRKLAIDLVAEPQDPR
jgi:hypothetical protein